MFNENSRESNRSSSQLELIPSCLQNRTSGGVVGQKRRADPRIPAHTKAKVYVVIDSSIIGGSLNEAIQTEFVHYSHSADFQASEKFEFCSIASEQNNAMMIHWTRHPLQLIQSQVLQYKDIFAYEPFVLSILDNDVFIDLVLKSADDFDFPELGEHVQQLFHSKNQNLNYNGGKLTTIVALLDLDKSILKAQRTVRM